MRLRRSSPASTSRSPASTGCSTSTRSPIGSRATGPSTGRRSRRARCGPSWPGSPTSRDSGRSPSTGWRWPSRAAPERPTLGVVEITTTGTHHRLAVDDPAMVGLGEAADGAAMADRLAASVTHPVATCAVEPISYRPGAALRPPLRPPGRTRRRRPHGAVRKGVRIGDGHGGREADRAAPVRTPRRQVRRRRPAGHRRPSSAWWCNPKPEVRAWAVVSSTRPRRTAGGWTPRRPVGRWPVCTGAPGLPDRRGRWPTSWRTCAPRVGLVAAADPALARRVDAVLDHLQRVAAGPGHPGAQPWLVPGRPRRPPRVARPAHRPRRVRVERARHEMPATSSPTSGGGRCAIRAGRPR